MDTSNISINIMNASMNLMRRLPPKSVPENLNHLCELIEDEELKEDVHVKTDQPIGVAFDEKEKKEFLKCEYNKDNESYRSPWSNTFFPPIEVIEGEEDYEPIYPSQELFEMEQLANDVFARYARLYYDNHFQTSVYFFDTDDNGFGSCWLVKKQVPN
jgi:capping protein (actin filament) muscle Z-line, beta